jgi:3-mercaptopyruvate sulfurtransferase SseA
MLRLLGYDRIAHLDGGLRAWQEAGLTVEAAP